jgi:LPXTG-site transpeptidase (sortase) family protein
MFDKALRNLHAVFDFIIVKRYVFAMIFFSVSFTTFTFLYATGLIPAEFKVAQTDASVQAADPADAALLKDAPASLGRVNANAPADARGEMPTRIVIDKIGVNSIITNPVSTDENVLDGDLAKGAVRYPTSGKLGLGNLFLFGHSTNHPIVNNQAYKTFNNLDKLNPGDQIVVESATHIYVYKVFSVRLTSADEALIQLQSDRNMLTISTCNTFGQKQERFVVEADFVKVEAK